MSGPTSMSKRDYELVARCVKKERASYIDGHDASIDALNALAVCLADEFGRVNASFNRMRFLIACGIPPLV